MKINIKSQEDMLLLFGMDMKITTDWKCKTTTTTTATTTTTTTTTTTNSNFCFTIW
jgi:hypothetical protein